MNRGRRLRVAFVDFWQGFDCENFLLTQALRRHHDVEICPMRDAEYVVYSVFGDEHWFAPQAAVKIFYTGENLSPDFNICDYALGFDHLTLGDRYMRLPNYYATTRFSSMLKLAEHKHELPADFDLRRDKPDFCSFVVSNGDANPIRREMFERLSAYKKVDSGGRYMNNIGAPVADKMAFDARHRFAITFENSSMPGYSTEKIVDAFAARCIPIYWGDPDVARVFNPRAFVNVHDYASLDDVVARVRVLDGDDDACMAMLREPALLSADDTYAATCQRLQAFVDNIVDQNPDAARRSNREFHGMRYVTHQQALVARSRQSTRSLLTEWARAKIRSLLSWRK